MRKISIGNNSGFTLMEMVTAAAIFSLLGIMLFGMVRTGMTTWKDGEDSRNRVERGVRILEMISQELRHAFAHNDAFSGEGEVRFYSDFVTYDRDGDRVDDACTQRLIFVRINVEERENERLRTAGDLALGKHHFTLFEQDEEVLKQEGALPTGGLAETIFMSYAPALLKSKKGKLQKRDGMLHLYRGYRSPIGGEDSFFCPNALTTTREIQSNLVPIQDGLLYLEFRFWNRNTLSFDKDLHREDTPEGAGYTWDSTRAILGVGREHGFNSFRFYAGEESLTDVTDDIFPERVRIFIVVGDPQAKAQLPRLLASIKKDDMVIPLDLTKPLKNLGEKDRFVRIDEEWIEFSRIDGQDLIVARRGARHTIASPHNEDSPVHYGTGLSTVVNIPVTRSCWNDAEDE